MTRERYPFINYDTLTADERARFDNPDLNLLIDYPEFTTVKKDGSNFLCYILESGHAGLAYNLFMSLDPEQKELIVNDINAFSYDILKLALHNNIPLLVAEVLKVAEAIAVKNAVAFFNQGGISSALIDREIGQQIDPIALAKKVDEYKYLFISRLDIDRKHALGTAISCYNFELFLMIWEFLPKDKRFELMNSRDSNGYFPITYAFDDQELIMQIFQQFTLEESLIILSQQDTDGMSTLMLAIIEDNKQFIKLALNLPGVPPQQYMKLLLQKNSDGQNIVMLAAAEGNAYALELLIRVIPQAELFNYLSQLDNNGNNAFILAAQSGSPEACKVLFEQTKLPPKTKFQLFLNSNPYNAAAFSDNPENPAYAYILSLLDRYSLRDSYCHDTLTRIRPDIRLRFILEIFVDNTLFFHKLCTWGNSKILKIVLKLITLRERIELLSILDEDNKNALSIAAEHQNSKMIQMLLSSFLEREEIPIDDKIALFNIVDTHGNTSLKTMLKMRHITAFNRIIDYIPDNKLMQILQFQCGEGKNLMQLLIENSHLDIFKKVSARLDKWLDKWQFANLILQQNYNGDNALMKALKEGKNTFIKVINSKLPKECMGPLNISLDNQGNDLYACMNRLPENGKTKEIFLRLIKRNKFCLISIKIGEGLFYNYFTEIPKSIQDLILLMSKLENPKHIAPIGVCFQSSTLLTMPSNGLYPFVMNLTGPKICLTFNAPLLESRIIRELYEFIINFKGYSQEGYFIR